MIEIQAWIIFIPILPTIILGWMGWHTVGQRDEAVKNASKWEKEYWILRESDAVDSINFDIFIQHKALGPVAVPIKDKEK